MAIDEEDDRKLRRTEKSASDKKLQKDQERKARQYRYNPYNYHGNRQGEEKAEGTSEGSSYQNYRSYGGYKNNHPYRNSSMAPDKHPPRRNINNDICYNCGARGHWANTCPEKKQQNEKANPEN